MFWLRIFVKLAHPEEVNGPLDGEGRREGILVVVVVVVVVVVGMVVLDWVVVAI
jgi:hypothetical protein